MRAALKWSALLATGLMLGTTVPVWAATAPMYDITLNRTRDIDASSATAQQFYSPDPPMLVYGPFDSESWPAASFWPDGEVPTEN